MLKIYLYFVLVLLLSCSANRTISKTGINEIHFGNGGGFTGEVKTYKLTDKKLYENDKELKSLDSKKITELFNRAKELKEYQFNEPGNMYSFIEIKTKQGANRIVWGLGSAKVDTRATALYNKLMSTVK